MQKKMYEHYCTFQILVLQILEAGYDQEIWQILEAGHQEWSQIRMFPGSEKLGLLHCHFRPN